VAGKLIYDNMDRWKKIRNICNAVENMANNKSRWIGKFLNKYNFELNGYFFHNNFWNRLIKNPSKWAEEFFMKYYNKEKNELVDIYHKEHKQYIDGLYIDDNVAEWFSKISGIKKPTFFIQNKSISSKSYHFFDKLLYEILKN
jgi:hypothetical protein